MNKFLVLFLFLFSVPLWSQCTGAPTYSCANRTLTTIPITPVPPQMGPNTCIAGSLNTCGNLTGAGTVITDPDFNVQIMRGTDANTEALKLNALFVASASGSGDESHFNCNEDRLTFADDGGRTFVSQFTFGQPLVPMYIGATYTRGLFVTGEGFFGHNCATDSYKFWNQGGTTGTQIGYYDVSNPAVTPSFTSTLDFATSANCIGFGSNFPRTLATNGAMNSGSAILTSASIPFTNSLPGEYIKVSGAGPGGTDLITTILSYQNTGQVTLTVAASTTVTGATIQIIDVQWTSGGETDKSDSSFALGLSNNGGQASAGAHYVAVYRVGSGCRVLDINTLTVTGDWGPTGSTVGASACGGLLHNVKMYKADGVDGAIIITLNGGSGCSTGGYIWFYTGLSYVAECVGSCSGHFTEGLATYANASGNTIPDYWVARQNTATSTLLGLTASLPTGGYPSFIDWHCGWNSLNDTYPFLCSTFLSNGGAINDGWVDEVIGIDPTGAHNPIRFGHTFNTGSSQDFATQQVIGSASPLGDYFEFSGDWMNTLGSTSGTATCIPSGYAWTKNFAYNSGTVLTIKPNTAPNNAGKYTFKATTPGTSNATTEPVWPQVVGNTVTDGTVVWTNEGANPNCRGDVWIMRLNTGTVTNFITPISLFMPF